MTTTNELERLRGLNDQLGGHGVLKCTKCKVIIAQCRCMRHDKIKWGFCGKCDNHKVETIKEFTEGTSPSSKSKITNEMVAEALGLIYDGMEGYGFHDLDGDLQKETPDFLNDLNAVNKYVWPSLAAVIELVNLTKVDEKLSELLFEAFQTDNAAMYLCERLMAYKGQLKYL